MKLSQLIPLLNTTAPVIIHPANGKTRTFADSLHLFTWYSALVYGNRDVHTINTALIDELRLFQLEVKQYFNDGATDYVIVYGALPDTLYMLCRDDRQTGLTIVYKTFTSYEAACSAAEIRNKSEQQNNKYYIIIKEF